MRFFSANQGCALDNAHLSKVVFRKCPLRGDGLRRPLVAGVRRVVLAALLIVFTMMETGAFHPALAQDSGGRAANSGPSTDQLFRAAREKTEAGEVDDDWPAVGRITPFPARTKAYVEFNNRLWKEYGILYIFVPTVMMQSGTQGGGEAFTAWEQYQGLLAWRLVKSPRIGTGYFVFNNLHVSQLTRTSGADFAKSLGISFQTTDSSTNTETIKALLWRHEFPGDVLKLFVGHDEIANLDGECNYSCDDTGSFVAEPLSTNPARTLPGQGPMIAADVQVIKDIFFEVAVADALGDGNLNFKRVFDTGDVAYAGALKFKDPFKQIGDGFYRFTYYGVEETRRGTQSAQRATEGLSIQLEQDVGDVGFFAKYSRTFQRKGPVEQFASAGVVWTKPFGNDADWLGLGFGWVEPTAQNTNDEYVVESFYRVQLTPFVDLTPGAMMILNPSRNPDSDVEGVFNLRMRGQY